MLVPQGGTYQGSTAEQDHEDNEGLEPVVLDDLEAGPAEGPPRLPTALGDVHVEEGAALHTGWGSEGGTASWAGGLPPDAGSMFPALSQGALSSPPPHCPQTWGPQHLAPCPPLLVGNRWEVGWSSPSPPGPPSTAYSAHGPTASRDGHTEERHAGMQATCPGPVAVNHPHPPSLHPSSLHFAQPSVSGQRHFSRAVS